MHGSVLQLKECLPHAALWTSSAHQDLVAFAASLTLSYARGKRRMRTSQAVLSVLEDYLPFLATCR